MLQNKHNNMIHRFDSPSKRRRSTEPVDSSEVQENCAPEHFFKKLRHRRIMTANPCDSLNNTLHPAFVYPFSKRCYKSVRLQFPMCKFPAVMLLSFKPVLLRR